MSKSDNAAVERGAPIRQRVLDAAERLLRSGKPEFSMRDLAATAGVSFATPFNQFGSKAGIMHALSGRRIDAMTARYTAMPSPSRAEDRVRLAINIAVAVMLDEPEVNRAVMGVIGSTEPTHADALARSTTYWALAIEGCERAQGQLPPSPSHSPRHLALVFRGALSFWTAGELPDAELGPTVLAAADALIPTCER